MTPLAKIPGFNKKADGYSRRLSLFYGLFYTFRESRSSGNSAPLTPFFYRLKFLTIDQEMVFLSGGLKIIAYSGKQILQVTHSSAGFFLVDCERD